ncbi:MAG TPA: NB-ARC domain-containing protein [Jatrophihabitans sp.]|nr:NB-ARC domain-containing protein [Jatrophihabitans sp.]
MMSYVERHGTGARATPPVTASNHLLPLLQLDASTFERLCLWLVRAEGFTKAEHYGAAGSDGGRDIVAFRGPDPWYFQCKRRSRLRRAQLEAEVAEVAAGVASRFAGMPSQRVTMVFVVTSLVSARLRDAVGSYAAERGLACEFWAATELDERIKRHPELVQEFFRVPPGWFVEDEVVVPRRLPHAPLRFVNRTPELASLDRLLDRSRQSPGPSMAVISGLHGVGKTALGRYWGNQRRGYFPHGDLYGDFSRRRRGGRVDASEVLADFLRELGTADIAMPLQFAERQRLFQKLTVGKQLLLLLDDVEEPAQALAVLPAGAGSVVVVTANSRMDALLMEGARHVEVRPLEPAAARGLIEEAIGAERVGREPAQIDQLIELCGGLPIALCVCAGRLEADANRTVAWLLEQLARERPLQALSAPNGYELEAIFDFTYADLPPGVAQVYRMLAIHPGLDISAAAASAMIDRPADEVRRALDVMYDAHLLESPEPDLFRMHKLIREHMANCLDRDESVEGQAAAFSRLTGYYLDTLEQADRAIVLDRFRLVPSPADSGIGLRFESPAAAFGWFFQARHNVISVLRTNFEQEQDERVWRLTETLWPLCSSQKLFAELVESHELAIRSAHRLGDLGASARLYSQLGRIKAELGDYPAAGMLLAEAKQAAQKYGDLRLIASVIEFSGVALLHEGRYDEALAEFHAARALFVEARRARGIALQDYHIGWAHIAAGDAVSALDPLTNALTMFGELTDRVSVGRVLLRRGQALIDLERDQDGRDELVRAIEVMESCGVRFEQAEAYETLSRSAAREQDRSQAQAHLIKAYRIYRELGHPRADELLITLGLAAEN